MGGFLFEKVMLSAEFLAGGDKSFRCVIITILAQWSSLLAGSTDVRLHKRNVRFYPADKLYWSESSASPDSESG